MADNVKRREEEGVILVTNVNANKTAGQMILVGTLVCVHKHDQLANATNCPVYVQGVEVRYAKLADDVVTQGAKLYYDDTNDVLTVTIGDPALTLAGIAAAAAAGPDATCRVHLGLRR